MPKRVTIRGKRWLLEYVPLRGDADGLCDDPKTKGKRIRICSTLKDQRLLEVLIHELTHAANWEWDEGVVTEAARDIAKVLWDEGYRKE